MKYIAVLDTDEFEDFNFFEDGKEKYLHAIDANSVNGEWIYLPFKPLEQEPQSFKWCTDCREYDQEKHCCHRWSKVIRDTVEEMKQEQEPVLDKIRAEIEKWHKEGTNWSDIRLMNIEDILDKYKAESEG